GVGRGEGVCGSETQEAIAGVDQAILPSVVGGEALAMRRAVVFDRKPLACSRDRAFQQTDPIGREEAPVPVVWAGPQERGAREALSPSDFRLRAPIAR